MHTDDARSRRPLARQAGQGTVEYVALVLLVAGVLAAVVAYGRNEYKGDGLGKRVTQKLEETIGGVGTDGPAGRGSGGGGR